MAAPRSYYPTDSPVIRNAHRTILALQRRSATWLVAIGLLLCSMPAPAQTVSTDLWVADGPVHALERSGSTLYVGGSFDLVGPPTGGGVPIDITTGLLESGFPRVEGILRAVLSDGAGGWYIGGNFTSVGGVTRNHLAHILSDNSVGTWAPEPNNTVFALDAFGSTIYVGGSFTSIGGQSRSRIAAVDATSGLATTWDPDAGSTVYGVDFYGGVVYVVGAFTSIGSENRNYLAALDPTTGLATAWDPSPNDYVFALQALGTTVYVGGEFTTIGGQNRSYIASLEAATGAATSWDPNPNSYVYSLTIDDPILYAGGYFTEMGGATRNRIAAINRNTGAVTPWDPNANNYVFSLAVRNGVVYAGGVFDNIGGETRYRIAALDEATGLATAWDPNANDAVRAVAADDGTVFAGGYFTGVNQSTRHNIASLDITTGEATSWDPNANYDVYALAVDGGVVYAGGYFTGIGGQQRLYIGAVDASTGLATSWNPSATGTVATLEVSGSTVYAGGAFNSIGGETRYRIAALDATTGQATSWNPDANNYVGDLLIDGTTVYAVGQFTNIGAQNRNYIAALDVSSGLASAWDPNADNFVNAVATDGSVIYAGGLFTNIGGQGRNRIAALDPATGLATSWNPDADGEVNDVVCDDPWVYAGGGFNNIGGTNDRMIALLDGTTGAAEDWWGPRPNGPVGAVEAGNGTVFAGGWFTSVGGKRQSHLASISAPVVEECVYTELLSDVSQSTTTSPHFYQFDVPPSKWVAVGVRPDPAEDWNISVHAGTAAYPGCVTSALRSSMYGPGYPDFIVGDFNYNTPGTYYASVDQASGSQAGTVELITEDNVLAINDTLVVRSMAEDDVIDVWNVYLQSGHRYYFEIDPSSGADLSMLLFENLVSGPVWLGRSSAQFETTSYDYHTAGSTGWYGLVVTNSGGTAATYTVGVGECSDKTLLVSADPRTPRSWANHYEFDQQWTNWTAIGIRNPGTIAAVSVYSSDTGTGYPICLGDYLGGYGASSGIAIAVGNVAAEASPPGMLYALAYRNAGGHGPPLVEWDGGSETIVVDTPPISRQTSHNDYLEMWDLELESGVTYTFDFARVGDADIWYSLFTPSISGWTGLSSDVFAQSDTYQYTASETGTHGVVVYNRNGGFGTYTLGVSTCDPTEALGSGDQYITAVDSTSVRLDLIQDELSWAAVGVRSTANWDLSLYKYGSGGSSPLCFSSLQAESQLANEPVAVDLVVGDFHRNPKGRYYPLPYHVSGSMETAAVEWEKGSGQIMVNGSLEVGQTSAGDFLNVWDVFLIAGTEYQIVFNPSGAGSKLLLFRASGPEYWAPRSMAELELTTTTSYVPPTTGFYGLVVVGDEGTRDYQIGVTSAAVSVEQGLASSGSSILALVPNPTAGLLNIQFAVRAPGEVGFEVLDVAGRRVAVLPAQNRDKGEWTATWSGARVNGGIAATGVYFVRMMVAGKEIDRRKFVVLR